MKDKNERGIALITALLFLVLMGALLCTVIILVNSSQKMVSMDIGSDRAFAGAFAALEHITQAMANMLATDTLTGTSLAELEKTAIEVTNQIGKQNANGETEWEDDEGNKIIISKPKITVGESMTRQIIKGAYEGLRANITSYTVHVTARSIAGEEVTLERVVQVVLIPVFQFGVFSDNDLAFFPGSMFNFGGRVHTNGNVYLGNGGGSGAGLWMSDRITAHGEIRTTTKNNGDVFDTGSHYVMVTKVNNPRAQNISDYSRLLVADGNDNSNYAGAANAARWKTNVHSKFTSTSVPGGFLNNGDTGAFNLDLPVAGNENTQPVDIIRRGRTNDPKDVANQRYYNMASLRILLSDEWTDLTSLPETVGTPIALDGQFPKSGTVSYRFATAGTDANYKLPQGAPLIGGYILIEKRLPDSAGKRVWQDVTAEIMSKGITGRGMSDECSAQESSGAIIRLQRFADGISGTANCNVQTAANLWPNALFDAREGSNSNGAPSTLTYNGVMHYVELDIKNLNAWLNGQIETGQIIDVVADNKAKNSSGYVVYFSDRRGSNRDSGRDTADYNFESVSANSGRWDLNGDGVPQSLTSNPTPKRTVVSESNNQSYTSTLNPSSPMNSIDSTTTTARNIAKRTRPVYFRRALKLVNGAKIELGTNQREAGVPYGLIVASENPVYIQGDYNYNFTGTRPSSDSTNTTAENSFKANLIKPGGSVGAAVLADAVTILSNNWTDFRSFGHTASGSTNTGFNLATSNRPPTATFYRLAIIAGKNNTIWLGSGSADWGTDGGVHNFLRMLEDWSDSNNVFYRGSLITMYSSKQAMSAFKTGVYNVPKRRFSYEDSFIDNPVTLPPRTPMVRYIDVLSFTRLTGGNRE